MKKLMSLMLGLGLAFGAVTMFAKDNAPQKKSTAKKSTGKKKGTTAPKSN